MQPVTGRPAAFCSHRTFSAEAGPWLPSASQGVIPSKCRDSTLNMVWGTIIYSLALPSWTCMPSEGNTRVARE